MAMRRQRCTRRGFLGVAAGAAAVGGARGVRGEEVGKKRKMVLSFYCDDTGPYNAGAKAFETFLDFCAEQKIAGESSLILGGALAGAEPREGGGLEGVRDRRRADQEAVGRAGGLDAAERGY